MTAITYVRGAERMVTAARLTPEGVYVRFADERAGVIPLADLALSAVPDHVTVPRPHVIEIHLANGRTEEVPWDFARHYADERYRERSEEVAARGRRLVGERLRTLRSERNVTQQELAERSGVSRVTIARIESGARLPRYQTLIALARGLDTSVERLIVGS